LRKSGRALLALFCFEAIDGPQGLSGAEPGTGAAEAVPVAEKPYRLLAFRSRRRLTGRYQL
jgi:hypothetical protein